MFRLFRWFKIVMITVLLTQHGFAVAKPMNCEEHPKNSVNAEVVQIDDHSNHQAHQMSKHHHASESHDSMHGNTDEECEKCEADDCLCCEGGICASFHLNAYLGQEEDESISNIHPELIFQRILPPTSGIHLLPYRPPIFG